MCNVQEAARCPACETRILVHIYPALFEAPATGETAEPILEEGTAGCFYHEQKKAVTHCDVCGRFLCALCDVDFNGQHVCPACLQAGKKKGKLALLDTTRTLWDSAALAVSVVPLLLWPILIVTAPVALGLAIISFFKPGSLIPRRRWRAVLAMVMAVLGLMLWVWIVFIHDS
jgi:hypothetical protein